MTEVEHFVLDTNVISSLIAVDWLQGVKYWLPEREVLAPRRVWKEIQSHWDLDEPEWLDVKQVDLDGIRDDYPGSISLPYSRSRTRIPVSSRTTPECTPSPTAGRHPGCGGRPSF